MRPYVDSRAAKNANKPRQEIPLRRSLRPLSRGEKIARSLADKNPIRSDRQRGGTAYAAAGHEPESELPTASGRSSPPLAVASEGAWPNAVGGAQIPAALIVYRTGTGDTRGETGNISRRDTTKRRQHKGGIKEDRGDRRQDDRRSATGDRRREAVEAGDPTQVTEHTH